MGTRTSAVVIFILLTLAFSAARADQRPGYVSDVEALAAVPDEDLAGSAARVKKVLEKANAYFNHSGERLSIGYKGSLDYLKPLSWGKNYLLLHLARQYERSAVTTDGPVYRAWRDAKSELYKSYRSRKAKALKQYRSDLSYIKRKYFKKARKTYYSKKRAVKRRYNAEKSEARAWYDRAKEDAVKHRDRAGRDLLLKAVKIYMPAVDWYSRLDEADPHSRVLVLHACSRLAAVLDLLRGAPGQAAEKDSLELELDRIESGSDWGVLHAMLDRRLKQREFFNRAAALPHHEKEMLSKVSDYRFLSGQLIARNSARRAQYLAEAVSALRPLDVSFDYHRFYLSLDEADYKNADKMLEVIKDKINDSPASGRVKAMEYIRHANQKANLMFVRGHYKECAEYHLKIREYAIKMQHEHGPSFTRLIYGETDPISGMSYGSAINLVKHYKAAYYHFYRSHNIRPSDSLRPVTVQWNDEGLHEDWQEKTAEFEQVFKGHAAWEKDHRFKAYMRLQLVLSLYQLDLDAARSAALSEDVMYKTQARQLYLTEYYATILNGFGKLNMKRYRQARVDFTKVRTILTGQRYIEDLDWVIGFGKTSVELEEYRHLYERKVSRLNSKRRKSLNYLKRHLKFSLGSLGRVYQDMDFTRLRTGLPWYVTPQAQLLSIQKAAARFSQDSLESHCRNIRESFDNYPRRSVYARYLARNIKAELFEIMSSPDGGSTAPLQAYRLLRAGFSWNPSIDRLRRAL